jgi:hypothetical protein
MSRGALARWMFDEYRSDALILSIYRIVFVLWLLLFEFPDISLDPRLPGFVLCAPAEHRRHLHRLSAAMVLALLIGPSASPSSPFSSDSRRRPCRPELAVLIVVGNSFDYSFGKIDHDILVPVVLSVMAGSGWGWRLSVDAITWRRPEPPPGWPLALLLFVIGLSMLSRAGEGDHGLAGSGLA